jgi:hypothetical protein
MMAFARASRNGISTSLTPSGTQPQFLSKEHELVHEGRNRSHFAWQGALQGAVRAAVGFLFYIIRSRHSEIILGDRN